MYSYLIDNDYNGKTAKCIKKHNQKQINHDNYKETLKNNKEMLHEMNTIRSEKHEVGSYKLNKVLSSCLMTNHTF